MPLYDDIEIIKLNPGKSAPEERDVVAEITQSKTRRWTSEIVAGFLFKEKLPGDYGTVEEALAATCRKIAPSGRKKVFYRTKGAVRKVIKKTRYVRG